MTKFALLAAACLAPLTLASIAYADDAGSTVEAVIVSANRTPTPADQVAASVTVIDSATLKARQPVALSDILAQTPGVGVVRNGGFGQTTTVRIRGAESEQTVVVLDGVRLNDPSSPGGGYDFSNLLAGDIDRIEVLRGPQSTLWGADAIGGVISLTSAAPHSLIGGTASAEVGGDDTRYTRAAVGGLYGKLTWRVAGGYFQTSGISAFDQKLGGKERDGALNATGSARLDYALTDWATLDVRFWTVAAKTAFDGFPPPNYSFADTSEYGESHQTSGYVGLKLTGLGGALVNTFSTQENQINRDNYDPTQSPTKTFYARGLSQKLAWQGEWTAARDVVAVFGAETERTTIRTASPASYDPTPVPLRAHATLDSVFVSGRAGLAPGLTFSLGLRNDDHIQFGSHATGSAGLAYTPDAGVTVWRASFGQGFKAPTLYQLYGDYGYTGLKPETANGFDAGVSRKLMEGAVTAGLSLFHRDVRQQIGFFDCFSGTANQCATRPYGFYANIDSTRAQGVEAELTAKLSTQISLTANYTFTDTENRSAGANAGKELARRPRDAAYADLSYAFTGGANLGLAVRYAGESFNNLANTQRLKAYSLVDLRGSLPIARGVELYGRVENLFDRSYETAYQYGTIGRTLYVGVRASY